MLHNVAQMVKEAGMLDLLEALAQKLLKCKNARRRVCVFWSREAVKLGLESAEMKLYIICLSLLIHMLSWFGFNEVICLFANLCTSEKGGVCLPRFGLWPGCT